MWHSVFHLEPSVMEKIVRPLLVYVFLLLAIRLGGQREVSQTSALQLVLLLSVANAVQNGIIGTDDSFTGAVIGATTLFVVNGVVEVIASRSPRFHHVVVGRPVELVSRGIINARTMRRHRISTDDLTQAAIAAGGDSAADIDRAQLASDGGIVVVLHSVHELREQIRSINEKLDRLLGR